MLFARSKLFASVSKQVMEEHYDGGKLYLIRANDDTGNRAYYFMLAEKERIAELKKALSGRQSCRLDQYGEVVASGYGEHVPESLKIRMRVEHCLHG